MRYRPLGRSGLQVSVVGLGCNNFANRIDLDAAREVLDAAHESGVTLLDTADVYGNGGGSEEAIGTVLGKRRDDFVIATKFGGRDLGYGAAGAGAVGSRAYIRRAVEESLRRLRTDRIDLYQIHQPDPTTPMEETLAALDQLVQAGKVLYIGSSQHVGWKIADAAHLAREANSTPFISAQVYYSLLARQVEAETIPAAEHFGVGILPYSPLADGLLTGKIRRGEAPPAGTRLAERTEEITDERLTVIEALTAWGDQHGRTLLEIAIGWLAAQPAVGSVIAGATKPEQVKANVAAGEWVPTPDEVREIGEIATMR